MFRRNTDTTPQKRPFSLKTSQIKEDIEAACICEDQRNMLFYALDEKPPQENKLAKMEEFLTGTNNLETVYETLRLLIKDVEKVSKEVSDSVEEIKSKTEVIKNI
uniref:Uncharacterized protein LOC114327047 n=1 Tax=Diabrotica virgifera virgifera TaxID=50390 RepID=A0A6P7FD72_DIAVI